jgi:hypothetical protein
VSLLTECLSVGCTLRGIVCSRARMVGTAGVACASLPTHPSNCGCSRMRPTRRPRPLVTGVLTTVRLEQLQQLATTELLPTKRYHLTTGRRWVTWAPLSVTTLATRVRRTRVRDASHRKLHRPGRLLLGTPTTHRPSLRLFLLRGHPHCLRLHPKIGQVPERLPAFPACLEANLVCLRRFHCRPLSSKQLKPGRSTRMPRPLQCLRIVGIWTG